MCDTNQLVPIRFYGWIMAECLGRWTQQWAAEGAFDFEARFQNWSPTREVIRSLLEFILGPFSVPCSE